KLFIAFNRAEQNEYLMYDFSGAVGDTLLSNDCEEDIIQSIDTLYLGTEPRKQFHLPEYSPNIEFSTLIEGIGSTFGFGYHACNTYWSTVRYLRCFSQDGNYIQIYPNFGPCEFILPVDPVQNPEFSIYPNPFTDEIEIHFANDLQQTLSVSIVNLFGAVVFEKQFLPQSSIEHISLPDLTAGMYLMCIRSKEGISTQKMIKQ
ncbi:MAG TPA: T9SS type A sorting domain-containing protein, partial [Saprospiraceae bacterium]